MKTYALFLGLVLALCQSAQDSGEMHHHAESIEKLGTVSFPISCSLEVQKPFELGVALLHSYWYEEADKQFKEVAAKDPACAMAYWGQAMTLHRPAYSQPSEQDLKRGWELVQKARAVGAMTAREREYIVALAGFYAGDKVDNEKRTAAWCAGMERFTPATRRIRRLQFSMLCRYWSPNRRTIRRWRIHGRRSRF